MMNDKSCTSVIKEEIVTSTVAQSMPNSVLSVQCYPEFCLSIFTSLFNSILWRLSGDPYTIYTICLLIWVAKHAMSHICCIAIKTTIVGVAVIAHQSLLLAFHLLKQVDNSTAFEVIKA